MNPIANPLSTSLLSNTNSSSLGTDPTRERLESVGTEFESVFMSMMIKEMRNSLDTGFFGEESSDTYGGMFDLFIGKQLAETRPLGIADMLLQQYEKNQVNGSNQQTSPDTESTSTTA